MEFKKKYPKDKWDVKEILFPGRFGRDELEQLQPWGQWTGEKSRC